MTNADLIYTTYIKTTPEKLWEAITNPEFARQYWGDCGAFSDWKKGSKWKLERVGNKTVHWAGEIMECVPPKRLVLTWASPEDQKDVSRVSFDIEPMHDLVCLVVVHGGFKAGSAIPGKVSQGWPLVFSSLKSYLETGKPIDILAIKGSCSGKAA